MAPPLTHLLTWKKVGSESGKTDDSSSSVSDVTITSSSSSSTSDLSSATASDEKYVFTELDAFMESEDDDEVKLPLKKGKG